MLSTYEGLWRQVMTRCPIAGPFLSQDWIRFSFRQIVEKRKWSWLINRNGQFIFPNQYTTGTATVTNMSNQVQGAGTAWTTAMIGYQFRSGLVTPIYTITNVDPVGQVLTLATQWGGASQSALGYQIYLAYPIVPSDFHSFTSVYDPAFAWQLWLNVKQEELNMYDAQRASQGTPYVVADLDYTSIQIGGAAISPPLPRYEIWPHQTALKVIPFVYEARPPDLDDANATLPRFINGEVVLEGALAQCASWPGPDAEHKNPLFNLQLAAYHEKRYKGMVQELERQDDEVYLRDVSYECGPTWPFAPLPFPINAGFLQVHAL